ncbi:hypothetical protein O3M35_000194 [Rhynocoris fuscipes]|uniref:Uncharacterized protein n=1 Tax=Rhynocoris fuscipes TaxID=488301 RepID=A0AAW1DMP5_9HEMI
MGRSAYTPKANQQLRLLSPEGHGVSKCKFICQLTGIESMIALVNARVRSPSSKVYDSKPLSHRYQSRSTVFCLDTAQGIGPSQTEG